MARDSAGAGVASDSPPAMPSGRLPGRWPIAPRWIPGLVVLLVLATIAALLALSLSGSSTKAKAEPPSVGVGRSSLGKILVNARGLTLYMYTHDTRDVSVCTEACARVWPPARAPGKPTLGAGLSRARLKTIRRSDHSTQLSYAGHPLYTFSEDPRPGQMGGEGFLGAWFVLSRAGRPIRQRGYVAPAAGY
ncbi:MAG: hypothetical protein JWL67_2633 [Solirubrobacterales bacterium]|nr:hypothetical protein [Solirubrobacterales bacterium]